MANSECRLVHIKPVNTRRNGHKDIGRNYRKHNRKSNQEGDGILELTDKKLSNARPTRKTDTHLSMVNRHYQRRNE